MSLLSTRLIESKVRNTFHNVDENVDKGTLKLLASNYKISRILALLATCTFVTPLLFISDVHAVYLGFILMAFGQLLRFMSIQQLGKSFTGHISIPKKICNKGIYKYVRHPGYTAGFIYILGIGFCLANIYSILILTSFYIHSISKRVTQEEKALAKYLDGYRAYIKTTKKFIPFIY